MRLIYAYCLAICLVCSGGIHANDVQMHEPVTAILFNEEESIRPGHPFWIGIQLQIDDGWHAYWKNPGDAGMTPTVAWNLPEGFKTGDLIWPSPKRFTLGSSVGFGYEKELILLIQVTPPLNYSATDAPIAADVRWVVCSDETCMPGESQASLKLPVKEQPSQKAAQHVATFKKARAQQPQPQPVLSAQRKQGLIELSFQSPESTFTKADFFPEEQGIDYKEEVLLETTDQTHKIILKEIETSSSLKGILVMYSATGSTAYDVNAAIDEDPENGVVSMSTPPHKITVDEQGGEGFEFEGGLLLAIGLAFLGGFLLNLMPCVLPVISFKILSFIKLAGESRRQVFQHGLAFAGGVLLSFWALAGVLLILQAYGRTVGWGFQLQEPLFVAILAAFIFLFALSLFGIFEMGVSLIGAAANAQQKSSHRGALFGSFLGGVLATAVATPCTGPFLGSAVGYAVTLPALQAMMVFTSLGLGMAWPYVAMAAFPSLLRFLPKPGPWMVTFKELMGFLMMGSVIWLVWVFSAQTGSFAVSLFLAGLFLLSLAAWVYGRWGTPLKRKTTRAIAQTVSLAIFCCGCYTIMLSASPWAEAMGATTVVSTKHSDGNIAGEWEQFSAKRVAELRAQGTPVFIDFTAKWCLICQANHVILSTDDVAQKFSDLGVVKMKADWTKKDEEIAAELRKFGRNSVPLYVLYGADDAEKPKILPQVLTSDTILNALEELADSF